MPARSVHARSFLVLALAATLVACDSGSGGTSGARASDQPGSGATGDQPSGKQSAAAGSAAAAPSAEAPPPAPEDLAVAELQKLLKCGGGAKAGPCAVLGGFAAPCTSWSVSMPSGDGRWMGRGFTVEGGKVTEGIALMRARRVPTSEVGPGQLPLKLALADLPADDPSYKQAALAVRTYERQDVPGKSNAGVEHVKQRTDWVEAFATRTASGQVYALAGGGTFVCQGPKQQLLLVRRAGSRTDKADGVYAELWATTW